MGFFDRFRKKPEEPAPRPIGEPPKGFETGVEAFAWRVLTSAYARILARQQGRDWMTIPDRELHAMLEPYHADLDRDAAALGAAIAQARTEGVSMLHAALHTGTGLDHEMIDEAFSVAYSQTGSKKAGKR